MTHEHKACYGTMFHDTLHSVTNTEMKGKVFSFELASIGLVRTDHLVKAVILERDDCLKCPEFEHCYKFCMAKLALGAAIARD